jgi:hypothetical protein
MTRLAAMQRKIGKGSLSLFDLASGSASRLFYHLGPKFESQVFASGISKLPGKFLLITPCEYFQAQRDKVGGAFQNSRLDRSQTIGERREETAIPSSVAAHENPLFISGKMA